MMEWISLQLFIQYCPMSYQHRTILQYTTKKETVLPRITAHHSAGGRTAAASTRVRFLDIVQYIVQIWD